MNSPKGVSSHLCIGRGVSMNERIMQDLLKRCHQELIEEGLSYLDREVSVGNRRLDLVFTDRRGRLLLVEAQQGSLDTKHIDRHIDFVEGFIEKNPNVDVRLMYIANKIDPLRKSFLDRRGYEYKEIPAAKLVALARDQGLAEDQESEQEIVVGEGNSMSGTRNLKADEKTKREKFMLSVPSTKEKESWTLFFGEIDKRSHVRATFKKAEFGVYIHSRRHFTSSGGKYSLMYTRDGSFKMNDMSYQGHALTRLKHWCRTPGLPEKFYSELKARNLTVDMEYISIRELLHTRSPSQIVADLLACIDLFK